MSRKLKILNNILSRLGKSPVKEYPEGLIAIRKDMTKWAIEQEDAPVKKPSPKPQPKKVEVKPKVEKKE